MNLLLLARGEKLPHRGEWSAYFLMGTNRVDT
jgi:hypothetical protein